MSSSPTSQSSTGAGRVVDRFTIAMVVLASLSFVLGAFHWHNVNGIPAHPLIVHVVVVFLPVAAIATLPIVWYRPWRRYLPALIVVALIALVSAVLASGAGEALQDALPDGHSAAINHHGEVGGQVPYFALGLLLTLLVARTVDRLTDTVGIKQLWFTSGLAATLFAVLSLVWVIWAGDLGSHLVWQH